MSNMRDMLMAACGAQLPVFRATSRHLSALNPFTVVSGIIDPRTGEKIEGIPTGYYGPDRSGGYCALDEFVMHQAGLIDDLNVKVFGLINHRKSAGEKIRIRRGVYFGRNHLVTDRKSHEYSPLAAATPGARVLKFGEDGNHFINPLDPAMPLEIKHELLAAMGLNALNKTRMDDPRHQGLDVLESRMLWECIIEAENRSGEGSFFVPTLPTLVEKLKDPSPRICNKLGIDREHLKERTEDLRLALMRLVDGDLAGMFHRETTPGLFKAVPLLVLDCDGVKGERAVVMITLINFFTLSKNAAASSDDDRFHIVVHDEAWDLSTYPGFVDSIRQGFKLGRTKGFSNRIVAHHLSNLYRSGNNRAIEDLVSDSSTSIIYRQDRKEIESTADALDLNEQEVERSIKLPKGHALVKLRGFPAVEVEHVAWDHERPLVETSHLVHGKTDLPRAKDIEPDELYNSPETTEAELALAGSEGR